MDIDFHKYRKDDPFFTYNHFSRDGFETVNSSCTVPYMHEFNLRRSQQMVTCDDYYNQDKHPHDVYTWTDYSNEDNYYMLWKQYQRWEYIYGYDPHG